MLEPSARRNKKLLSEHDVKEVAMFMEYLRDKETMGKKEFFRKWQEYMCLSDAELNAILEHSNA